MQGMIRGRLRKSFAAGLRFCYTAAAQSAGEPAAHDGALRAAVSCTEPDCLWAMTRVSRTRGALKNALRSWRIPGTIDKDCDGVPQDFEQAILLDKLQVHQFYWNRGLPAFICTRFRLHVYGGQWDLDSKNADMLFSAEAYPHLVNLNDDDDIINIRFVSTKVWGKRCPIRFLGEEDCLGVKRGGVLKKTLIYLAFDCELDRPIPDITVDLRNLDIGDEISIQDLNLGLPLRSSLQLSTNVCKIERETSI